MKTRFCPSPTGLIHLGNMRTALFNALATKAAKGVFLLRIEDTDKTRSKSEYTEALKTDLLWLGMDWQEGPDHEKDNGPYWQSQRQAIYDKYYTVLQAEKKAYPCFCTEQELALSRKVQLSSGKPPRYSGKCRELTANDIAEKEAAGLKPTLRFRVPDNTAIEFVDLIKGQQHFKSQDIGDFIIRRADGTPPFMYCNAIDDSLMGVTQALRGEDHVTNTPRQLMILEALGLRAPDYGHFPLIVGSDGSPLSKRNGSKSVQELRKKGFLPIAVINYLARLGHYFADNRFMSLDELASQFSLSHIGSSSAHFDEEQLLHWQKEAIMHADFEQLWTLMNISDRVPAEKQNAFVALIKPNIIFPGEAALWADALFTEELSFNDEATQIIREAGSDFFKHAVACSQQGIEDSKAWLDAIKEKTGKKGKALFQPIRIALTGQLHGPELAGIIEILGTEKVIKRLSAC